MHALYMNACMETWQPANAATSQGTEDYWTRISLSPTSSKGSLQGSSAESLKKNSWFPSEDSYQHSTKAQSAPPSPEANTHQLMTGDACLARSVGQLPTTWQSLRASRLVWSRTNPTFKNYAKSAPHSGTRRQCGPLQQCPLPPPNSSVVNLYFISQGSTRWVHVPEGNIFPP